MRKLPVLLLFAAATAAAEPSGLVVRDDRFADLGMTPSLGRGYSPAANTMYSVCFATMPTTRASFDFDYEMRQLDEETRSAARGEADEFLSANAVRRTVNVGAEQRHVHYLIATLKVDSYYSSIDESKARLSDGTMALLRAGDMLAFFGGCGTHYLRSISRRSSYLTLFSYTSTDGVRDVEFERRLDQLVQQFDADGAASDADKASAAQFDAEARTRDLRTVSRSIGLVAQHDARLLPFDLASYRAAVLTAFQASQDEFVGRVTAVELAPWLSNPTVLAALDSGANALGGEEGTYARRQRLADNADVYAEMVARVHRLEAMGHRAHLCRRALDGDVFDEEGRLRPEMAQAQVINHRTGERVDISVLIEALKDEHLQQTDAAVRADTLATSDSGAGRCIAELEKVRLVETSHREIPACGSQAPMVPHANLIQDLCLPDFAATGDARAFAPPPPPAPDPPTTWIRRTIFKKGA